MSGAPGRTNDARGGRRIAIVNWSNRVAGGAERYIESVMPALVQAGNAIALWSERDAPVELPAITRPPGVEGRTLDDADDRLAGLRAWRPDLLYVHGIVDTDLEAALYDVAPIVYFAHSYVGTCISGTKTWMFPNARPCSRRFGWPCLVHFYPHRCGGLDPRRMVSDYARQGRRLALLRQAGAVVTASEHMRREYLKHRLAADRVMHAPLPAPRPTRTASAQHTERPAEPSRILWVGRMTAPKGGAVLISAATRAARSLGRALVVSFVGDGPDRLAWERAAGHAHREEPRVTFAFHGWLGEQELAAVYGTSDLLALPSLWPEPFGLVGLEAGTYGVPVTAFAGGGIPEWLTDGTNGTLADGRRPTVTAFADALDRALRDGKVHARLRHGAREVAAAYTLERHLAALERAFDRAERRG